MASKLNNKKFFVKKTTGTSTTASSAATEDHASKAYDGNLLIDNRDPTHIKSWVETMGLEADKLFPTLSTIFFNDANPAIMEVEEPTEVLNDANDPHHIMRGILSEDIKRFIREKENLKKASSALAATMLAKLSAASIAAIKMHVHERQMESDQGRYEHRMRSHLRAVEISDSRREIRIRRERRARRHAKSLLKLKEMESKGQRPAAPAASSTASKPKTRRQTKEADEAAAGATSQDEPPAVSTASSSSAAAGTSAAVSASTELSADTEQNIFIIQEDSDTDGEDIPDNDNDIQHLLYEPNEPQEGNPEVAWNSFRVKCDALELWLAIKTTHIVRKSGNATSDFHSASSFYWALRQKPHQTLDRYYEIWMSAVNVYHLTSGGQYPATEQQMAQRFVETLDPTRWGMWQAECLNNSNSWKSDVKAAAYPTNVNAAYHTAGKIVVPGPPAGDNRKHPLAMTVVAKMPATKSAKSTYAVGAEKKAKKEEVPAATEATNSKPPKPCNRPCNLCGEMHWTSDCPHLSQCRTMVRAKSAKSATTHLVSLCTTAKSFATDRSTRNNGELRKNIVIDDSASDVHIFRDRELLTNIREADEFITLTGINEAGEQLVCTEVGDYGEITPVYISDGSATNVLSHALLEDEYPMEVVQGQSITYQLNSGKPMIFHRIGKRYVHHHENSSLTTSVTENKMRFSKREIERADKARNLVEKLNHPGESTVEKALKSGTFDNTEITVEDLHRAQVIYGPDVHGLKGRTTRPKPSEFVVNPRTTSQKLRQGTLSIDIMNIEGSLFLVGVIDQIGMTLLQYVRSRSASTLIDAINGMTTACEENGWVVNIRSDNEKAITTIVHHLRTKNFKTAVDFVAPGCKVPIVERKQRTLKEKVRATMSRLQFTMPTFLIKWLTSYVVATDNMLPTNSGNRILGDIRSPREIFFGRRIDVKKDLRVTFGQYVQLYDTNIGTINSMQQRTRGAIALGTIPGSAGTARFWVLATNRIVTAHKWIEVPIDDVAIAHINSIAVKTGKSQDDPPEQISSNDEAQASITETPSLNDDPLLTPTEPPPAEEISAVEAPEVVTEEPPVTTAPILVEHSLPEAPGVADIDDEMITATTAIPTRTSTRDNKGKLPERYTYTTKKVKGVRKTMRRQYVFNINTAQAIREHGTPVINAIVDELTNILSYDSLRAVNAKTLTRQEAKKVMRSKLFLKMKRHPDGSFDRWKARLVAGGHTQNRNEYALDETSSPTVALWAVFTLAALRKQGSTVKTIDIKSAYLNAEVKSRELLMRVDPRIAAIVTTLEPEWASELDADGSLVVRLNKALYGCVESAKLFYEHLKSTLGLIGYIPLKSDPCVYLKRAANGDMCTIATHVDDLHIIASTEEMANELQQHLQDTYGELNVQNGVQHEYLGMQFNYKTNSMVEIRMDGYINQLLLEYGITTTSKYPCALNLFEVSEISPLLSDKDQEKYRSMAMKVLYLAIRIRPDLLTALSYITTKLTSATEDDMKKLLQVLSYLNHTSHLCLTLSADEPTKLRTWIDASHGTHADCKSHTGGTVSLGKGSIHAKSSRQKINSKSSTESELIGMSDYLSMSIQILEFLRELGTDVGPATIFQDNMSTLKLIEKGRPASDTTRHIAMRYFFAKDRVDKGDIEFLHCPTDEMMADFLTKPLLGKAFFRHRDKLLNLEGTSDYRGVLRLD